TRGEARDPPRGEDTHHVLRERQTEASGFSGKLRFQLRRQIHSHAHGCSPFFVIVANRKQAPRLGAPGGFGGLRLPSRPIESRSRGKPLVGREGMALSFPS